jgi:hypothetical protein
VVSRAVRHQRTFLGSDEVEDLVQEILLSLHAVRTTYDAGSGSHNTGGLQWCLRTGQPGPRWQYTGGGLGPAPHEVQGIGLCDRDRFNGTLAALKKLWGV